MGSRALSAKSNATPAALLPRLRVNWTNCSLLAKENEPAKKIYTPQPALIEGN